MEPIANCPGTACDRYRGGRLIRGMCQAHYKRWAAAVPLAERPKARQVKVGCSIDGCEVDLIQARGWCAKHYSRWQKYGDPQREPIARPSTCAADNCDRPYYSRSYCVMHYSRLRIHGTPDAPGRVYAGPDCEAPDCERGADHGRYCGMHASRKTRLGVLELPERTRYQQASGYWRVRRPDHPLASQRDWIREHRVVLYDAIGPGEHPCHWCGTTVSWDKTYPRDLDGLTADHLDENPGNNDPTNLVPSCAACNLARSSRWKKRCQESS